MYKGLNVTVQKVGPIRMGMGIEKNSRFVVLLESSGL